MVLSQVHYLVRSKADGQYLAAHPRQATPDGEAVAESGFLLLFREQHEALSYLNAHAPELTHRFTVESISGTQLKPLMDRWGFLGVGLVNDPLTSDIEFLARSS
jgi:hypothetical protein